MTRSSVCACPSAMRAFACSSSKCVSAAPKSSGRFWRSAAGTMPVILSTPVVLHLVHQVHVAQHAVAHVEPHRAIEGAPYGLRALARAGERGGGIEPPVDVGGQVGGPRLQQPSEGDVVDRALDREPRAMAILQIDMPGALGRAA